MALTKNILANYLGAGVIALAPVLALPWYLAALGPKQYGLLGFIVMLQAVLGLIDAGMSQALVREFAVRLRQDAAALLFGFERLYWLFALCAGGVLLLLADFVAAHWLNLEELPLELGREAVYGAAAIFAVQFPGSVYRSLLIGVQAQVALNGIMLSGALLRHLGGVIVVLRWPTLAAYLIWQVSIALLETLVRGLWAWRALEVKRSQAQWEADALLPVWKQVAAMSAATWLGALTVQMDKIVLSRMATIEQFGYYTIAATVAAGVLQLVYPLVQAALPHAIQLRTEAETLRRFNIKLCRLISLVVGAIALAFIMFGEGLLKIWLRNPEAVATVYPFVVVLLMGSALNAFYNVGYINWIAHGKTHRVFQVNALALLLATALIPLAVASQGTIGAAFGWLVINLIGFVFSLDWLTRKQNERSC